MTIKAKVSALIIATTLVGCSSTKNIDNINIINRLDNIESESLYGYLDKDNNGEYSFTKFTYNVKNSYAKEPWVRLKTLSPHFNTNTYDCRSPLFHDGAKNNALCDADKYDFLFRSTKITTGDLIWSTVGNVAITALTFGLGIYDLGGFYTGVFDEKAFQKAVNQAAVKLSKTDFVTVVNQAETHRKKLTNTLHSDIDNVNTYLQKTLKVTLNDKSQLYGKLPDNLVNIQAPSKKTLYFDVDTFTDPRVLEQAANASYSKNLLTYGFSLDCRKSIQAWNIQVNGCEKQYLPTGDDYKKGFEVEYVINSKKNGKYSLPISLSDSVMSLNVSSDDNITITNLSNKYLVLDSLTFYVNNDVETKPQLNIELPPHTQKELSVSRMFKETTRSLEIRNFTKHDLSKKMKLGAALRYRFVDTGSDKTLYKTESISASKLISL